VEEGPCRGLGVGLEYGWGGGAVFWGGWDLQSVGLSLATLPSPQHREGQGKVDSLKVKRLRAQPRPVGGEVLREHVCWRK
jgi:hypothetical protein